MFPTAHPDLMGQLAIDRVNSLREAAARFRLAHPSRAWWRPVRFVEPDADLDRVIPAPAQDEGPSADRAA